MSDHPHRSVSLPEFLWLIELHKKASNRYVVDLINKTAENKMYRYYSVWLVDNRTVGMTIGCLADVIAGCCKDAYVYRGLADAEYREQFMHALDRTDGLKLLGDPDDKYIKHLRSLALYTIGEDSETQHAK